SVDASWRQKPLIDLAVELLPFGQVVVVALVLGDGLLDRRETLLHFADSVPGIRREAREDLFGRHLRIVVRLGVLDRLELIGRDRLLLGAYLLLDARLAGAAVLVVPGDFAPPDLVDAAGAVFHVRAVFAWLANDRAGAFEVARLEAH